MQARANYTGVVKNEKIARSHQRRQIAEAQVGNAIFRGIDMQQAAGLPLIRRVSCYQLVGQVIVEVGQVPGRAW